MNDSLLTVSELFYSIQGESSFAGFPCCFVRLSGCNLRCRYCDSHYTWDETGKAMSIHEIIQWLNRYPKALVELTGGEPLLQPGIYDLFQALLSQGRTILIETNGSVDIDRVPVSAHTIMDLKCPESGMESQMDWKNIERLRERKKQGSRDEIKFVLSSEQDFHWARGMIETHKLSETTQIIFSPVRRFFAPDKLARLILEHQLPVRMQLQLHTIIWPNIHRGV